MERVKLADLHSKLERARAKGLINISLTGDELKVLSKGLGEVIRHRASQKASASQSESTPVFARQRRHE